MFARPVQSFSSFVFKQICSVSQYDPGCYTTFPVLFYAACSSVQTPFLLQQASSMGMLILWQSLIM